MFSPSSGLIILPSLALCERACSHGTCVATNVCQCDEGWEGEICIDFVRDSIEVPLRILSNWNITDYAVVSVAILAVLFASFLLVVKLKRDPHFARDITGLFHYLVHCCRRPQVYSELDMEQQTGSIQMEDQETD
jgi:hypothetical protein